MSNITMLAMLTSRDVEIALIAYERYEHFNGSRTSVASGGAISINDPVGEMALVWSVDNSVPLGELDASSQASTAAARFSMVAAWFLACMGVVTVGLALM